MTLQAFGLLLVSILANASVQFLLKVGGKRLINVNLSDFWVHICIFTTTPELLAGIACSALSAVAYGLVLSRIELSIAGPASALVYIFSVGIGHFLFKEQVPISHVVGLGLIVCGVVLIGSKS